MGADQSGELGKGFLEELTSGQVLKMSSKVWQMGEDVGEGLPRFWLGLTGPSVKPWVYLDCPGHPLCSTLNRD